ncbi:MAG TPA: UbiA family prenyltransferase [Clostridiales bacterium]|nr:UbiA family prenyltransferase [Clostridiales bacterium]HQP69888.1 UbiA family prenyltransferase [Clostridiales bacterium]
MNNDFQLLSFLKQYIKSMRLYYSFVTGIAGWLGFAFYEHIATDFRTVEIFPSVEKKALIISLLFLSWGINQIVNDYLGLKEDRINAPERPMVTGKLDPNAALLLSAALMLFVCGITYFYLEPVALIPLVLGVLLNVVYEYSKAFGIWGNIIFGLMITMCTAFGFLAAGPTEAPYFTSSRIAVLVVVWLMNGLMTFYTYFKDYEGDKAAGKNTIIVKYGIERSRIIAIFSAFLPAVLFIAVYSLDMIEAPLNTTFFVLAVLTLFLEIQTGWLYYKNPKGQVTYYSLATNFRSCACGQATFIALFNRELSLILFLVSYIFVGFLFNLHNNSRS